MSMRKHLGRSRALRPSAEFLEGRQLLSATVSGTDTAGDQWTLTLKGSGTLQVVKQDDPSTGYPGALDSATEIKSITVAGTNPDNSVLTGTVKPAAGSNGEVFFENLTELNNQSDKSGGGLGLKAVNMPDFYLGVTDSSVTTSSTQPLAEIDIPDGVNTLKFGGVDTTAFFGTTPADSPAQDGQNDEFLIKLGLPESLGTSIIVKKIISNGEAGTTSSSGTVGSPTQKAVIFDVNGRINLFQANEIDGNTQYAPASQSFLGGTIVASFTDTSSAITGEIGFVRVGGNATNFSVVTNHTLSNMYVGGEANNVSVLTPDGSRNFYFGKGFDTSSILSHSIENLQANRGAVNSSITTFRMIGDIKLGGDVDNSTFLSGYNQGLATAAETVESNLSEFSSASAPTISVGTPVAGGMINAFVAGNINNSVFAASVLPISQVETSSSTTPTQEFGNTGDAYLPLGTITARVEGAVQNSTVTPNSPNTAFYAKTIHLTHSPVVTPKVVEEPLAVTKSPVKLVGISSINQVTSARGTGTTVSTEDKTTKN
jgi:hypothetical protein